MWVHTCLLQIYILKDILFWILCVCREWHTCDTVTYRGQKTVKDSLELEVIESQPAWVLGTKLIPSHVSSPSYMLLSDTFLNTWLCLFVRISTLSKYTLGSICFSVCMKYFSIFVIGHKFNLEEYTWTLYVNLCYSIL